MHYLTAMEILRNSWHRISHRTQC